MGNGEGLAHDRVTEEVEKRNDQRTTRTCTPPRNVLDRSAAQVGARMGQIVFGEVKLTESFGENRSFRSIKFPTGS